MCTSTDTQTHRHTDTHTQTHTHTHTHTHTNTHTEWHNDITVQISHNAAAAYQSPTTAIQYIEILPRMEGDQYL